MPVSQQRLQSINFTKLKNLQNVSIDLSEGPLIAIMGVNGIGKSTVLHALACCYKPDQKSRKDYKFSEFFLPNSFAQWNDSDFTITYSFRDGPKEHINIERQYQKNERWTPRYVYRPERYVSFFGISSCVPDIESDKAKSFVSLTFTEQTDETSKKILSACKYVLNIPYKQIAICENKSKKEYLGVLRDEIGKCTSLSMGAGEQRIFKILSEAYRCPKYAMILVDEIDLLLHENALKRLIQTLYKIAVDRNLQIIFTTHSMLMADLAEYVKIRYLVQTPTATLVQTSISTDAILQLTGTVERPIHVYVEDDLSHMIINKACAELNCKRFVHVFRFGAAINSFTLIAGKVLNGEDTSKTVAIIDGDVYRTEEERSARIKEIVTGDGEIDKLKRKQVFDSILLYNLPADQSPEMYIRKSILSLDETILPTTDELRIVLDEIGIVDDRHKYIDDAISRLELDRQVGLAKIIDYFAKTSEWDDFISPIKEWLDRTMSTLRT